MPHASRNPDHGKRFSYPSKASFGGRHFELASLFISSTTETCRHSLPVNGFRPSPAAKRSRRQHVADPATNEFALRLPSAGVEGDVVGNFGGALQHHDA